MRKWKLLVSMLVFAWTIQAQNENTEKRLPLGKHAPDHTFSKVLNAPPERFSISDLKGKAILLDYWSVTCGSCIAAMPELHELQRKYNDQLQVILVNVSDSEETVRNFIKKRERVVERRITLPVVYGDTVLTRSWFGDTRLTPRTLWIDRSGIVRHFTTGSLITSEKNVTRFLLGKDLLHDDEIRKSTEFKENILRFTCEAPYLPAHENLLWQSEWYSQAEGLPPYLKLFLNEDGLSAITAMNRTIADLYRFAYGTPVTGKTRSASYVTPVLTFKTLIDNADSLSFGLYPQNKAAPKFSCRIFGSAFTSLEVMLTQMRNDLDGHFDSSAAFERRKIKCLVLKAVDTVRIAYKSGATIFEIKDVELRVNNFSVEKFIRAIHNEWLSGHDYVPPYMIIDETRFKGKLGLVEITGVRIRDYRELSKALHMFGLGLSMEERYSDVLVIRKRPH